MKRFLGPGLLSILSLALYVSTLAPTVVTIFDDSLELQLALPSFAIVHPTGYPLYTLLGWLTTKLLPMGDAAYRANFFSALAASAAVGLCFLVARRLGSATIPAFVTALLLAVSPVWWSQATIAEVYAFQGLITLLLVYALLRWEEASGRERDRWLAFVGLAAGLGLTHHRLTLLLLPAAAVFILWAEPGLVWRPRAWLKPVAALLAPLLFYAILPLRSHVGSLDGSYARIGFGGWVLGGGYSTFLSGNPFGIQRHLNDLLSILNAQFGLLGMAAVVAGFSVWRMQPRRLVLLALIAIADLAFASRYMVQDIEVFLMPLFIAWALFIAVGLTALWDAALLYLLSLARRLLRRGDDGRRTVDDRRWRISPSPCHPWSYSTGVTLSSSSPPRLLASLLAILLLLWPALLAWQRLPDQDRSAPPAHAWGVHDYGLDMLDSVEPNAAIIGILGEMTLVRYFQRTQGLQLGVQTIAADAEPDRLAEITASVAAGRPTYTTRPLAGLPEAFSLSAAGPLVRVQPPGSKSPTALSHPVGVSLTPEVSLEAWDIELRQPASGPNARLRLLWQPVKTPPADFKISARLVGPDGSLLAQTDDFPVRNSFPPSRWRPGEAVLDSYDLPLAGRPNQPVTVQIILYNPDDGAELGRWEQAGVALP